MVKVIAPRLDDPKLQQVAILSSLHVLAHIMLPFPVTALHTMVAVVSAASLEMLFLYLAHGFVLIPVSSVIAALSLTMLVHFESSPLLLTLCGSMIIPVGKQLLRWRGHHLFNPSNFAIIFLFAMAPHLVRVTPILWEPSWLLFLLFSVIGIRLVIKARVWQITLIFLIAEFILLLITRSVPFVTVDSALSAIGRQMGAPLLLIFAYFMITDPRTTPKSFLGRLWYAQSIAVMHYLLMLVAPPSVALFLALFVVCGSRPFLARLGVPVE